MALPRCLRFIYHSYNQGCRANRKVVGTQPRNAILKQLQTHFEATREKRMGTPFPCVPAPLHLCIYLISLSSA